MCDTMLRPMLLTLLYLILAVALASLLDIDLRTARADLSSAASQMMNTMVTLPYIAYLEAAPGILTSLISRTRSRLSLAYHLLGVITTPSMAPFLMLLLGALLATAICDLLLWIFWISRQCWKIIRWTMQSPSLLLLIPVVICLWSRPDQPPVRAI